MYYGSTNKLFEKYKHSEISMGVRSEITNDIFEIEEMLFEHGFVKEKFTRKDILFTNKEELLLLHDWQHTIYAIYYFRTVSIEPDQYM